MTRRTTSRGPGRPRRSAAPPRSSASRQGSPFENHILKKDGTATAATRYPAQRYLNALLPSGRRAQLWALSQLARYWRGREVKHPERLAWHTLTAGEIGRLRENLRRDYAPATINRCLTALRQVLRCEWRQGRLTEEAWKRLTDVRGVRMDQLPGHAAARADVEALLRVCEADHTAGGARDAAVIALLYCAGLRRAEAAALHLMDLHPGGEVKVVGKGEWPAFATLGAGLPWVERWLQVRGTEPGPLLVALTSRGALTRDPIGGAAVGAIVVKRVAAAGLPRRFTAHSLRRGFASELLRAGNDHLMVARALRHRDMRSVQRYDGRSDIERALAVRAAVTVKGPRR